MIGGSARAAGAIHWTVSLVGLRQCAHHPCSCSAPSRSRLLRSERNPRHRERGPLMHVSFPHWFGATSVHSAGDGSPPCRGSLDSRECSTPARRPAASGKRRAREKRGFPSSTLFRPFRPSAPSRWHHRTPTSSMRSEEHTSELQSPYDLVCRLLLEKKK